MVLAGVLDNPSTPERLAAEIVADAVALWSDDTEACAALAAVDADPESQQRWAQHPDSYVRLRLARRSTGMHASTVPTDRRPSRCASYVRLRLARNRRLGATVAATLAADNDAHVLYDLLANPACPVQILNAHLDNSYELHSRSQLTPLRSTREPARVGSIREPISASNSDAEHHTPRSRQQPSPKPNRKRGHRLSHRSRRPHSGDARRGANPRPDHNESACGTLAQETTASSRARRPATVLPDSPAAPPSKRPDNNAGCGPRGRERDAATSTGWQRLRYSPDLTPETGSPNGSMLRPPRRHRWSAPSRCA